MKIHFLCLLALSSANHLYGAESPQTREIKKELASVHHGLKNVREKLSRLDKSGSLQMVGELRRSIRFMESCIAKLEKFQKNNSRKCSFETYRAWKKSQIEEIEHSLQK